MTVTARPASVSHGQPGSASESLFSGYRQFYYRRARCQCHGRSGQLQCDHSTSDSDSDHSTSDSQTTLKLVAVAPTGTQAAAECHGHGLLPVLKNQVPHWQARLGGRLRRTSKPYSARPQSPNLPSPWVVAAVAQGGPGLATSRTGDAVATAAARANLSSSTATDSGTRAWDTC